MLFLLSGECWEYRRRWISEVEELRALILAHGSSEVRSIAGTSIVIVTVKLV